GQGRPTIGYRYRHRRTQSSAERGDGADRRGARRSADALHDRGRRFRARAGEIPPSRQPPRSVVKKTASLRSDFATAATRLEEALALPKNDIVRDSAIQRFEISFELCWKYLKAFLEDEHNVRCTSPRTCFRAAFKNG